MWVVAIAILIGFLIQPVVTVFLLNKFDHPEVTENEQALLDTKLELIECKEELSKLQGRAALIISSNQSLHEAQMTVLNSARKD